MWTGDFNAERVRGLLGDAQALELERQPLKGGLESAAVEQVTARYRDSLGRTRLMRLVIKELVGPARREVEVYEALVAPHGTEIAPRLLDVQRTGPDRALLYLESIRPARVWPWRDIEHSALLFQRLAEFHRTAREADAALPEWDYEAELEQSAISTLQFLEQLRRKPEFSLLARDALPAAKRVVLTLRGLRAQLLAYSPFGPTPIHGDLHTGNALVRRRGAGEEPVLIDWGRARIASPLEDVSSWLQSLGFYELEARRRHDTLLSAYRSAQGLDRRLSSDFRTAYWLAGASNALAGALRYHLWIADSAPSAGAREGAMRAAKDWLRVIRRAAAASR